VVAVHGRSDAGRRQMSVGGSDEGRPGRVATSLKRPVPRTVNT
jgi:phage replication-related protein YjqB (UPF0714/DUF867 family)